jgi:hypothetical protein
LTIQLLGKVRVGVGRHFPISIADTRRAEALHADKFAFGVVPI